MNPDGSGQHAITDQTWGRFDPAWSPDGTRIAFTTFRSGAQEVWVMNADGSNEVKLTTTPAGGGSLNPAWSPDGRLIAFARVEGYNTPGYTADIWLINADGTNPVRLTTDPGFDSQPTWEP
jgi:TolB protein